MKLPVTILQALAAAIAAAGIAGCNTSTAEAPSDKDAIHNAPDHENPRHRMPDGCPGCGMG